MYKQNELKRKEKIVLIRQELNNALKEAMKSKDNVALSTVRLILAALKDRDISVRSKGQAEGVTDADILSMLQTMIKQRNESVKTYRDAGREELAVREEDEMAVIKKFLPAQLEGSELNVVIDKAIVESGAASVKDMGKVMNVLKEQYAGQIDMGKAGPAVRERLA